GVAQRLGMAPLAAARSIYEVVNDNMANAASVYAAEQGIDLRDFTLLGFGGAAPTHVCDVAARLGIAEVRIPGGARPPSAPGRPARRARLSGLAGVIRLRLRLHARTDAGRLDLRERAFCGLGARGPPASCPSRDWRRHFPDYLGRYALFEPALRGQRGAAAFR